MAISSPQVCYGLQASVTPGSLHVSNDNLLGTPLTQAAISAGTVFYSFGMQIAAGHSLIWNTATGAITGTDAGISQIETFTVTAASGCTSNGTCNVIVTGSHLTGSPITLPVALTTATHTTATLIRTAINTALSANAVIAAQYAIGGSGANGTLSDITNHNSDSTLNVDIPAGLGITAAATSANTAGRIPSLAYRLTDSNGDPVAWDQKDREGRALATATLLYGILIKMTSGTVAAADATPLHKMTLTGTGAGAVNFDTNGTHPWSALSVTFTAAADTYLTMDVLAG